VSSPAATVSPAPGPRDRARLLAPGVAFCAAIAVAAWAIARVEVALFDYALIEAVVLAILLGMLIRAVWTPPKALEPGIAFTAKRVLEVAIVLLGASLDLRTLGDAGVALLAAVVTTTSAALGIGILAGRRAGLTRNLATLVAVGNAICGNSAIAAVAPVIRAKKQEVASAISLTAVLGVVVVLTLPLLQGPAGLTDRQYGVLAGMVVYAVPQVLAATFPVSDASGQIGALVKLVRVALLGPVVALFAFLHRADPEGAPVAFSLRRYVPWFVAGFFLTAIARTAGIIPDGLGGDAKEISRWLTVAAMAALGLGVDLRAVRQTGPRVAAVVAGLLVMLIVLGIALIRLFGLE
jgi:uncharacterized integral membrane protein (TIGR00698 family)